MVETFSLSLSLHSSFSFVYFEEYRRQVENFSSSRLRTLEYDFTRREELHERLLRRLKCAQYLHEHLHLVDEQFPSGLIDFLSKVDLDTVSMSNVEQLEEYSILDCIRLPNDDDDEEIEL